MGGAASSESTLQSRVQDTSREDLTRFWQDLPVAHQECVRKALASLEHSEAAPGEERKTSGGDSKVFVALISGRSCTCHCPKDRTIGDLKLEAQQELGVAIKSLIGPNMEPLNEGKTLEEENILPGNTLTVVVVDQAAEDEKEAAECGNIFHAAGHGRLGAVRHFLRTQLGAARATEHGRSPLHRAAWNGHREVCGVLLAADADVDARDSNGQTPLFEAARFGRVDAVKLLLEAKAIASLEDDCGETPLSKAREEGHDEVVKLLEGAEN
eukprot:s165_g33.t1